MLISEIQSKVGLTKKSIRYYEEEKLLEPKRNRFNDYREYDDNDLKMLQLIKFLRELGVPIRDIKRLKDGELTLSDCMEERVKKIEEEEKNYVRLKVMCQEIALSKVEFLDIDVTKYSQVVNVLGKTGFTMRDTKKDKQKKIGGAILSSLSFSAIFIFLIGLISYFQFKEAGKMPWIVYSLLMMILGLLVFSVGVNLLARIREIKGGEEDEASKY